MLGDGEIGSAGDVAEPRPSGCPVQISRFLVVDPRQRYTAGEALAHPFFQQYDVEEVRHFSPFRKFKVGRRLGAALGGVFQLSWEKLGAGQGWWGWVLGGCGSLGADLSPSTSW